MLVPRLAENLLNSWMEFFNDHDHIDKEIKIDDEVIDIRWLLDGLNGRHGHRGIFEVTMVGSKCTQLVSLNKQIVWKDSRYLRKL